MSPDQVGAEATLASPLERVLRDADPRAVRDLSPLGKVEVRGDLDRVELEPGEELVRLGPRRALVLRDGSTATLRERLRARGLRVYDATAGYAGLQVEGERLMRRLTELDLDALPAVGRVADVQTVVVRDEGESFRLFVSQDLGHYLAEVVLDHVRGLSPDAAAADGGA